MERFHSPATKDSPEIVFDGQGNRFLVTGRSFPEDCELVYGPAFEWLDEFGSELPDSMRFVFHYNYVSSTTAVYVAKLLEQLRSLTDGGRTITVAWTFDQYDDDIEELGKKFEENSGLKFEFLESTA